MHGPLAFTFDSPVPLVLSLAKDTGKFDSTQPIRATLSWPERASAPHHQSEGLATISQNLRQAPGKPANQAQTMRASCAHSRGLAPAFFSSAVWARRWALICSKTTGAQQPKANAYRPYATMEPGGAGECPARWTSHNPLTGCTTPDVVDIQSARTTMRPTVAIVAGSRVRCAFQKYQAVPEPNPNSTVLLRMCSVLASR